MKVVEVLQVHIKLFFMGALSIGMVTLIEMDKQLNKSEFAIGLLSKANLLTIFMYYFLVFFSTSFFAGNNFEVSAHFLWLF